MLLCQDPLLLVFEHHFDRHGAELTNIGVLIFELVSVELGPGIDSKKPEMPATTGTHKDLRLFFFLL
jgi:hypothetical protein